MKTTIRTQAITRVLAVATVLLGLTAGQRIFAEDAATKPESKPKEAQFLFVQSAKKVSFADGKMTMKGVSPTTILFSDRPERIAGHEPTVDFVKGWTKGPDSFASNNPNAALSIFGKDEATELVVILSNPVLERGSLTYDIKVLEGKAPAGGGQCSLFIDVIGRPLTPVSGAGVARRTTRRVVRRR